MGLGILQAVTLLLTALLPLFSTWAKRHEAKEDARDRTKEEWDAGLASTSATDAAVVLERELQRSESLTGKPSVAGDTPRLP